MGGLGTGTLQRTMGISFLLTWGLMSKNQWDYFIITKDPCLRIKILTIKPNNKDPDPDPDSLITIKIPAFRKGKKELSGMKVEQTRRIARMFAFM